MLNVGGNPFETSEVVFFHLRLQKFNNIQFNKHKNNDNIFFTLSQRNLIKINWCFLLKYSMLWQKFRFQIEVKFFKICHGYEYIQSSFTIYFKYIINILYVNIIMLFMIVLLCFCLMFLKRCQIFYLNTHLLLFYYFTLKLCNCTSFWYSYKPSSHFLKIQLTAIMRRPASYWCIKKIIFLIFFFTD